MAHAALTTAYQCTILIRILISVYTIIYMATCIGYWNKYFSQSLSPETIISMYEYFWICVQASEKFLQKDLSYNSVAYLIWCSWLLSLLTLLLLEGEGCHIASIDLLMFITTQLVFKSAVDYLCFLFIHWLRKNSGPAFRLRCSFIMKVQDLCNLYFQRTLAKILHSWVLLDKSHIPLSKPLSW